jgi:hypothetical protein
LNSSRGKEKEGGSQKGERERENTNFTKVTHLEQVKEERLQYTKSRCFPNQISNFEILDINNSSDNF